MQLSLIINANNKSITKLLDSIDLQLGIDFNDLTVYVYQHPIKNFYGYKFKIININNYNDIERDKDYYLFIDAPNSVLKTYLEIHNFQEKSINEPSIDNSFVKIIPNQFINNFLDNDIQLSNNDNSMIINF